MSTLGRIYVLNGVFMQNNQVATFIKKLSKGETLDLSQYKDPRFCKDLKRLTLKKIQALLIELSEIHLHFEGKPDRFYLSSFINRTDSNGLNLLDYCAIAGLEHFPMLFAVLGCELHQNVQRLYESLQVYYDIENAPRLVLKINGAFSDIEQGKQQNMQTPLTLNKKLKLRARCIENFKEHLQTHRIALFLIIFGIGCLIGTPFTVGANSNIGTIILFSVGIPALYTGLSDFQSASAAKRDYDQVEAHNRTTQEGKILRVSLELVTQQIFEVEHENRISNDQVRFQLNEDLTNKLRGLMFRSKSQLQEQQPNKAAFKRLNRSISM